LGRLSCLIHTPGTMQKRCGVVPTAVEPGPRVLLSQWLEWRENRTRSTRPRDNHLASECDRLTGESKAHNHADALAFQPFEPVPACRTPAPLAASEPAAPPAAPRPAPTVLPTAPVVRPTRPPPPARPPAMPPPDPVIIPLSPTPPDAAPSAAATARMPTLRSG